MIGLLGYSGSIIAPLGIGFGWQWPEGIVFGPYRLEKHGPTICVPMRDPLTIVQS